MLQRCLDICVVRSALRERAENATPDLRDFLQLCLLYCTYIGRRYKPTCPPGYEYKYVYILICVYSVPPYLPPQRRTTGRLLSPTPKSRWCTQQSSLCRINNTPHAACNHTAHTARIAHAAAFLGCRFLVAFPGWPLLIMVGVVESHGKNEYRKLEPTSPSGWLQFNFGSSLKQELG